MEVDVGKEAVKVLLSLLFGVGAGLFFEIFRLSRAVFSGRAAAVFLCDLLFWVVLSLASVLFFAGAARGGDGGVWRVLFYREPLSFAPSA